MRMRKWTTAVVNKPMWIGVSFAVGLLLLAGAIRSYDAPLVLGALVLLGLGTLLFLWPEVATLAVVFVLYSNLAGVAVRQHLIPKFAAAGFMLALGIPLIHHLILRKEKLRVDLTFATMLAFLVALLASSFFAVDYEIAGQRVLDFVLEGLVLYLLILNAVRSMTTLKRVIWVAVLTGGLLGAFHLYQGLSGSYGQQFGGLAERSIEFKPVGAGKAADQPGRPVRAATSSALGLRRADRALGPLGDPNFFAQTMLALLPLAFFMYKEERSWKLRLAAVVAAGLILSGIFLAYSRGAFVALAILVVIMTLLRYFRPAHVVAGIISVAVLVAIVHPSYYGRIETIANTKALISRDSSVRADGAIRGRATEMLAVFSVFVDHPLFGVGPGQHPHFYSVSYQTGLEGAFRQIYEPRRGHSLYLEMAAETGLIGLSVFLAIVLRILFQLARVRRRLAESRPQLSCLATSLALSLIAYLAAAIFLHLPFERYYWFLIALSSAALQILASAEEKAETGMIPQPTAVVL